MSGHTPWAEVKRERELHNLIRRIVLNWGPEKERGAARQLADIIIREVRAADAESVHG